MGLIKYERNTSIDYDVKVGVRLNNEERTANLSPAVILFPVYCPRCTDTQNDFYCHLGSRYGQVGEVTCEFCGSLIAVDDRDNRVDNIRFNQTEFFFAALYRIDRIYLEELEAQQHISLWKVFKEYEGLYSLTLDQAREMIEQATGITTEGNQKFITDSRITKLPDAVNRWIELLHKCGVKDSYLKRVQ